MNTYDSTRIKSYCKCPRHYAYRHVLDWTPTRVGPALVFGLSMHTALAHVYKNIDTATAQSALEHFTAEWLRSDLDIHEFHPRSVSRAKDILTKYFDLYGEEIKATKVYGVEVPFALELTDEITYTGRMDAVVKLPWNVGVVVLEHKTSSSFRGTWVDSFYPNIQISGYTAGVRAYSGDLNAQVMVNGLLVQKSKVDFMRIPHMQSITTLNAWRWEVADIVADIEFDLERFKEKGIGFRQNPESCQNWGGCEYWALCKARARFSDWIGEPCPNGYKVEPWSHILEQREKNDAIHK